MDEQDQTPWTWRSPCSLSPRGSYSTCFTPPLLPVPLPTPFTPDTHQLPQPGGWREEGAPSFPHSPAPKPERARQCQLLQMCLPPLCPCWGTELGLGPDPQLPALQPFSRGEGAVVRPKEELRNVLFICVCDQGALPHPDLWPRFSLVYFSHCKFLVQTQRKKLKNFFLFVFKKRLLRWIKLMGTCLTPTPALFAGYSPTPHRGLRGEKVMGEGQIQQKV